MNKPIYTKVSTNVPFLHLLKGELIVPRLLKQNIEPIIIIYLKVISF